MHVLSLMEWVAVSFLKLPSQKRVQFISCVEKCFLEA